MFSVKRRSAGVIPNNMGLPCKSALKAKRLFMCAGMNVTKCSAQKLDSLGKITNDYLLVKAEYARSFSANLSAPITKCTSAYRMHRFAGISQICGICKSFWHYNELEDPGARFEGCVA